jgi:FtsZ-binding cell division protein ZapB
MKNKAAEVSDLKSRNKQLADELAVLQNSINSKTVKDDESDRCSKLTKVVSNKSKEITDLKAENKSLKERNQSILMKMNEASSTATALETKNTRLESQVENKISTY